MRRKRSFEYRPFTSIKMTDDKALAALRLIRMKRSGVFTNVEFAKILGLSLGAFTGCVIRRQIPVPSRVIRNQLHWTYAQIRDFLEEQRNNEEA